MKRITCMIFLLCTVFVLSAQESAKTLVVESIGSSSSWRLEKCT